MDNAPPKRPSGAQQRKAARDRQRDAEERERDRSGNNAAEDTLIATVGEPPIDPVGNQRWANNLASAMAWITVRDKSIPREMRFKQAKELLAVVGLTKDSAATAARLEALEKARGIGPESKTNGVDTLPARPKARAS